VSLSNNKRTGTRTTECLVKTDFCSGKAPKPSHRYAHIVFKASSTTDDLCSFAKNKQMRRRKKRTRKRRKRRRKSPA
jgi:hypothetical protein